MRNLHILTLSAALFAGSAFVPAVADPRPTALPQSHARISPVPVPDCPAEPPIARLRWNWNHGNQRIVIEFLRRCFPELLDNLPDSLG